MNLMKLLAVGQSLKEEKIVFGKYKPAHPGSLPKFSSTVRPSTAHHLEIPATKPIAEKPVVAEKPIVTENTAPEETAQILFQETVVEAKGTNDKTEKDKTQKIPVGTVLKRAPEPVEVLEKIPFTTRIGKTISTLRAKAPSLRRKKKNEVRPVQTELLLEKIKVARNDLSEADLEIVSAKKVAPSHSVKTDSAALHHEKFSGLKWIKKTTGLFKTTSPFEKPSDEKVSQTDAVEKRVESELAGKL